MSEQTTWTSLWVDSIDRKDWMTRAKEAIDLDGVEEVEINPESGEVRVRYDYKQLTSLHLHSHLRAAGL